MSEVQIAIIDEQDTQITLAVPGVQGPSGAISSGGSANQVFYKVSGTNYDAGWTFIGNANVDAAAAIAGTKISPNFGSQATVTTGTNTAASFIPTSSSIPSNGIYLPGANQVGVATNGTQRLTVDTAATTSTLPVVHPLGAVGTPSITFTGDLNTGIYSPAADTLALVTAGNNTLHITSEGLVGIGTSSPDTRLHLYASNTSASIRFTNTAAVKVWQLTPSIPNVANSGFSLWNVTDSTVPLHVTNAGLVGIGTTSPDALLTVNGIGAFGDGAVGTPSITNTGDLNTGFWFPAADTIAASTAGSERARIDSSGRLLVGTSTSDTQRTASVQIASAGGQSGWGSSLNLTEFGASYNPYLVLQRSRNGTIGSHTVLQSGDLIGGIQFNGSDGDSFEPAAAISAFVDGTPGAGDMPGRLVFSTTADGAASPTERMRIRQDGRTFFGTTDGSTSFTANTSFTILYANSASTAAFFSSYQNDVIDLDRKGNDGSLVSFRQDGTQEGTISVSGTTVSYNGAHLSRWSQLPSGAERTEILRGTVLSNIDEMCEWGNEDNEQLNRMKVSDVEGDKNVAGVFQAWDDDDDTYTNDFYCAMTGDFIIRIAADTTVERGDLLMSAGDGTAKPQDDDIIRSKTIAKVTSTNVSCTYADGSYCVPCVLMAC